jgi:hypothetical protein
MSDLSVTMFGLKAGENNMAVGLQLTTGNITGSIEKWLDGPVKEMMKRDRFGPYADLLGCKASTLAPPSPSTTPTPASASSARSTMPELPRQPRSQPKGWKKAGRP